MGSTAVGPTSSSSSSSVNKTPCSTPRPQLEIARSSGFPPVHLMENPCFFRTAHFDTRKFPKSLSPAEQLINESSGESHLDVVSVRLLCKKKNLNHTKPNQTPHAQHLPPTSPRHVHIQVMWSFLHVVFHLLCFSFTGRCPPNHPDTSSHTRTHWPTAMATSGNLKAPTCSIAPDVYPNIWQNMSTPKVPSSTNPSPQIGYQ